jgi:hypothetical protein
LATGESVDWFRGRRLHRDCVDILLIEMATAQHAQHPTGRTQQSAYNDRLHFVLALPAVVSAIPGASQPGMHRRGSRGDQS